MRSSRSAVVAVLSLSAVLLAGCTGAADESAPSSSAPDASPTARGTATPTVTVSPPTAPDALPRDAASLRAWAALALPENALGGSTVIARGTGQVGETGASVTLPEDAGAFEVVLACQSLDGSALGVRFGSPGELFEVPCSAPGGDQPAPTRLPIQAGAVLVDATADAVFVYEVHPRSGT